MTSFHNDEQDDKEARAYLKFAIAFAAAISAFAALFSLWTPTP